jgi:hypothetical protein
MLPAFGIFALMIIFMVVMFSASSRGIKKETKRLQALHSEIVTDINNGDMFNAKLKMADLVWSYTDTWSMDDEKANKVQKAVWQEKRKLISEEIEKLEKQKK